MVQEIFDRWPFSTVVPFLVYQMKIILQQLNIQQGCWVKTFSFIRTRKKKQSNCITTKLGSNEMCSCVMIIETSKFHLTPSDVNAYSWIRFRAKTELGWKLYYNWKQNCIAFDFVCCAAFVICLWQKQKWQRTDMSMCRDVRCLLHEESWQSADIVLYREVRYLLHTQNGQSTCVTTLHRDVG